MDPDPHPLSPAVQAEIEKLFPANAATEVAALLVEYGSNPHARETERVQLDILRLCKRDPGQVRNLIAMARTDYRDVLMAAEYQRMRLYVVWLLSKGPNWAADWGNPNRKAHFEALKKMKAAGALLIGGRLDDEEDCWMYLFLVDSVEEAQRLAEEDPAVQSGFFSSKMRPWITLEGLRMVPLPTLPY
jgi:uncharacterized protein YciI